MYSTFFWECSSLKKRSYLRQCIARLTMGFTYPIPDRWRMCTISYSIPRWRTAISWGVSAEARMWYTPECIDKRSKNLPDWKVHITLKTQAYDLCSLLFNIIVFVECPSCPDWKENIIKIMMRDQFECAFVTGFRGKTRRICHIYDWKRRFWS